jgi:hypothetical protein
VPIQALSKINNSQGEVKGFGKYILGKEVRGKRRRVI